MVYENWRASLGSGSNTAAHETPLFTDAHVTGEITEGYGPYQFLNSVPGDFGVVRLKPTVFVRIEDYYSPGTDEAVAQLNEGKTDDSLYHGGSLDDEIAALVSLALGMRCRAGGVTRLFPAKHDPRGRPINWMSLADPTLPPNRGALRLPRAVEEKALGRLTPLLPLPTLAPADARVLIRVARLYQDAVWLAEAEPELTWLMLVSAVEAAAGYWRQEREPALERLRAWGPGEDLETILREVSNDLVMRVADLLAPVVGARVTFTDFLLHFCPDPPEDRPRKEAQHPWSREELETTYKLIYKYRSQTLHGGGRFPAPMCNAPFRPADAEYPDEIPLGIASATKGGSWFRDETRMLLHTFEDIARRALLAWWEWLGARRQTDMPAAP